MSKNPQESKRVPGQSEEMEKMGKDKEKGMEHGGKHGQGQHGQGQQGRERWQKEQGEQRQGGEQAPLNPQKDRMPQTDPNKQQRNVEDEKKRRPA